MQNSHLEFNTSSCLWKRSRVASLSKSSIWLHTRNITTRVYWQNSPSSFLTDPLPLLAHALHVIIAPSARTHMVVLVKSSAWINLQRDQLPTKLQNSKNTKTDTTFWCLKMPKFFVDIYPQLFLMEMFTKVLSQCSFRGWRLSKWDPSTKGPFWHLKRVKHKPYQYPYRILHFNSGSQAVPTWKLLVVSVTFMWFAGKLR